MSYESENNTLQALDDEDLTNTAGGIAQEYVGGASKYNRCKASNGRWSQYCNRPNWVDVGESFKSTAGDTRKQMICLNCGAQAQFKLYGNGQWDLPSNGRTQD